MNATAMNQKQKAAALLLAIGPDAAASLFPHMSEDEVESLTREVAELGDLDVESMASILQEVHVDMGSRRRRLRGDRDSAAELVRAWRGSQADTMISRVLGAADGQPFAFLRAYPNDQVIEALEDEHPQTIALVVANLPHDRAAKVLRTFAEARREDIAHRVATLSPVQRSVINRVEQALHARLGAPKAEDEATSAGGERDLASVLNQMGRDQSDAIMAAIEARDPQLAARIRESMFVFEDLTKLENRALQEVLRGVEPMTLATALKAAPEAVSQMVWSNLSERAATAVREEMELLGKLKKSDVEASQLEVVKTVRRLADEGAITIDFGGDEELV